MVSVLHIWEVEEIQQVSVTILTLKITETLSFKFLMFGVLRCIKLLLV